MSRPDAIIEDSQQIAVGTSMLLAVDFREIDGQSFTISSATVTIHDANKAEVDPNLTNLAAGVTTGDFSGEVRVQRILAAADMNIAVGIYSALWSLVFLDGQTRLVRQALEMRAV